MSLRSRLFVILIASTSVIWLCGIAWIDFSSRIEIEHLLDSRLVEAARMVISLATGPEALANDQESPAAEIEEPLAIHSSYEHRMTCQIWSFDGHMVGRSRNAPLIKMTDQAAGFSEPVIDGVTYRVFAIEDRTKGVRVLVGDNLGRRGTIVRQLLRSLLVPAAVMLPLIALLIWISIGRGLGPLKRATEALSRRQAENLDPIEVGRAPSEIRPLIAALNLLFEKVVAAREHERSFIAYAAHELRTPLAGLRTQAQIAATATDPKMRSGALEQTLRSADRTSRLIRQLLAISKLDASLARLPDQWIDLESALRDICHHIARDLHPERISFSPSIFGHSIAMDRELFDLAARNLLENALQLTPPDGLVRLSLTESAAEVIISVEDDGPGIPEDEHDLVLQRFYRGRNKAGLGSGLGLPIVTAALDRANAKLRLGPSPHAKGLKADIVIDSSRIRLAEAA